jgi:hypothetical protein
MSLEDEFPAPDPQAEDESGDGEHGQHAQCGHPVASSAPNALARTALMDQVNGSHGLIAR